MLIDDIGYYVQLMSPAVVVMSLIWLTNVIHSRRMAKSSISSGGKSGGGNTALGRPGRPAKLRNEFISRPGHRSLIATQWIRAHESKGWFVLIATLLSVYILEIFYRNAKQHNFLFSIDGWKFLSRVFFFEIGEFATVILLIYFFAYFAFVLQWAIARQEAAGGRVSRTKRQIIHAVFHIVNLGFVGLVVLYLSQRRYAVSISYRFAVAAETFVMYMKSVSYMATNYYLWDLKSGAAVSGTGSADAGTAPSAVLQKGVSQLTFDELRESLLKRGIDCKSPEEMKLHMKELSALDDFRKQVYPSNINLANFIEFTCMPVLVYEPKYPRTERVDYVAIFERGLISVGLLTFQWFLMEHFIIPSIIKCKTEGIDGPLMLGQILELMIPLQLFAISNFYLVFECILGANAEITKLADREFYSDWWNSTSFEEFSRKWNKPVHEFLLRHVHMECQTNGLFGLFRVSRMVSTILTFMYSIIAHEVVLFGMFGIFRPYLGILSMFQIPLWYLMRSPLFTNKLLGNIVFWTGLTIAYPLILVLYGREYCNLDPANCTIG